MSNAQQVNAPRPTWLVISVLSASGVIVALQSTLLVPLLAVLPGQLDASIIDVSWLVTITLLTGAVATPIISKLADMHGKRRLMLFCLGCAVVGNALAIISNSFALFLISRAIVGIAVALVPVGISMMRDVLPHNRLGFGIGMMSMTLGVGGALGLPLGGAIFQAFGWHAVFIIPCIASVALVALVPIVAAKSPTRRDGRFDVLGGLLLSAALSAMLLVISKGNEWGWISSLTLLCAGVALIAGVAWFGYERRARNPVIDIAMSLSRPVLLTNIATLALGISMFANLISSTQQAQVPVSAGGLGLGTLGAGLVMLPAGLSIILIGPLSGWLVQRHGGRLILIAGSVIMVLAYVFRILFASTFLEIALGGVLVQIGVALVYGATPAVIMRHVPLHETASANGVNALVRSIGNATSSAIVAVVFGLLATNTAGSLHPSPAGFSTVFAGAATAAGVGAIIALWIPTEHRARDVAVDDADPVRGPNKEAESGVPAAVSPSEHATT